MVLSYLTIVIVEEINAATLATDTGPVEDLRNMPPPIFSRLDWPQSYG